MKQKHEVHSQGLPMCLKSIWTLLGRKGACVGVHFYKQSRDVKRASPKTRWIMEGEEKQTVLECFKRPLECFISCDTFHGRRCVFQRSTNNLKLEALRLQLVFEIVVFDCGTDEAAREYHERPDSSLGSKTFAH